MIESSIQIGSNCLITTDNWFTAPDGEQYKAVYGEIKGIIHDYELLGIKTNRHSTNWYLQIGEMVIAGCQIYYAIKTNDCSTSLPTCEITHEGKVFSPKAPMSRIYFA